jgi:predicted transcriptional regulator
MDGSELLSNFLLNCIPDLKDLKERGLASVDKNKSYSLTKRGEKALEASIQHFFQTFHDIDEMRSCCKEKK